MHVNLKGLDEDMVLAMSEAVREYSRMSDALSEANLAIEALLELGLPATVNGRELRFDKKFTSDLVMVIEDFEERCVNRLKERRTMIPCFGEARKKRDLEQASH